MASALSPRTPAPKLSRTEDSPRKAQSVEQARAVSAGITLRAGPTTEKRLHRGVRQVNFRDDRKA